MVMLEAIVLSRLFPFKNPFKTLHLLIAQVEHLREEVNNQMATLREMTRLIAHVTNEAQRVVTATHAVVAKFEALADGPDVQTDFDALSAAADELSNAAGILEAAVNPNPGG